MGAGKTTIGKMLAKQLQKPFYDLDWYIENRMRQTIDQIFTTKGEKEFRKIEYNMLHEVAEFENVVISLGGGTPCFYDNMEYVNKQAETIFLKTTPEVIMKHLEMGRNIRPILKNKTKEEILSTIIEQLEKRTPYYEKARHIINVETLDTIDKITTTVKKVCECLEK